MLTLFLRRLLWLLPTLFAVSLIAFLLLSLIPKDDRLTAALGEDRPGGRGEPPRAVPRSAAVLQRKPRRRTHPRQRGSGRRREGRARGRARRADVGAARRRGAPARDPGSGSVRRTNDSGSRSRSRRSRDAWVSRAPRTPRMRSAPWISGCASGVTAASSSVMRACASRSIGSPAPRQSRAAELAALDTFALKTIMERP